MIALAFAVAVEIAADRGLVAVDEPERRDDQPDDLQRDPKQQQRDRGADHHLHRAEGEFHVGDADAQARPGLRKIPGTEREGGNDRDEDRYLDE